MRSLSPKSNPKTTPPTSKTKTKQNRVDFDELAPFFENPPPELRFLPTGVANFDRALGGEGLPSNVVTHWRAPHTFTADALLLELCRAACARGERVCVVDASNRFGPARLQVAGLDAFQSRSLFERFQLATISEIAPLADAWRRGEAEGAPDLLVVDSLVAVVETDLANRRNSERKISNPRKQGEMFYRLLVKLGGFARACGAVVIVAEPPIGKKDLRFRTSSDGRRNNSLQRIALGALVNLARVEVSLETKGIKTGLVWVQVAPNRYACDRGSALIDVRGKAENKRGNDLSANSENLRRVM